MNYNKSDGRGLVIILLAILVAIPLGFTPYQHVFAQNMTNMTNMIGMGGGQMVGMGGGQMGRHGWRSTGGMMGDLGNQPGTDMKYVTWEMICLLIIVNPRIM